MTGPWASRLLDSAPRQPDQVSCGAACLVVARALTDERYAELLVTGRHPTTGHELSGGSDERFTVETHRTHRRVTSPVDLSGRTQPPWPRRLGTPPWALARELSPGVVRRLVYGGGAETVPKLLHVLVSRPVPLYVGTRRLPRHVVLAVRADATAVTCYEPSSGRLIPVPIAELGAARCPIAGWTRWWWAVLPTDDDAG